METQLYLELVTEDDERARTGAKFLLDLMPESTTADCDYTINNIARTYAREVSSPWSTDARQLQVLKLEAGNAHLEGRRVPSLLFLSNDHWNHVLRLPTKSQRMKFYDYLWQIEKKKMIKEQKKVLIQSAKHSRTEKKESRLLNNHIIYGLSDTSMFLRIYDSTITRWLNNRLTRAMQFSPKLVMDCSYDKHMSARESLHAAKQLMLCFADNRANYAPFDLHYCNVDLSSICMQSLLRYIPSMLNPAFPININSQGITEAFPAEQIVYLTPHCRNDLQYFNPDDIYVIGAMVNTKNNEPLSLAKARKLKLRMARLPLDENLQWAPGSGKSLTLDQLVRIMLDLKNIGNWRTALQHVPRRKIAHFPRVPNT